MYFRKLGQTGLDVSLIGFGAWQLGGKRWAPLTDEESIRLLQEARNVGVNLYDVAVVYGQYTDDKGYLQSRAQELLGTAFRNRRDTVIYCLKLGQFDEYCHRADYHPRRIIDQFNQSLRRLQTDYIDICLIHAPSLAHVQDQYAITVLQTLQAQGKVRAIGYSFENEPEHVQEAVKQDINVIMLQYNLIDRQCTSVISAAQEHGIGIIVGGPFKRGYLTGKYRVPEDLPTTDDYWQWNLKYNRGKIEHLLRDVNTLLQYHDNSPKKLRNGALGCILKHEGVSSIIIGHRSMEEVKENISLCEEIIKSCTTPYASIIYEKSPKRLVSQIIDQLKKRHY